MQAESVITAGREFSWISQTGSHLTGECINLGGKFFRSQVVEKVRIDDFQTLV